MTTDRVEAPRKLETIHELVEVAELSGVRFEELSSRRPEKDRERPEDTPVGMEVRHHQGPESLVVRFRMTVTHPQADYVAEVGTYFTLSEPVEFSTDIVVEFIERVAVMAAYPFLREAIATMAARLEVDVPMLGLLKAGQFQLHPDDANDQADAVAAHS